MFGSSSRSRRMLSEYGSQLKEKQKLKFLYGLRERQFENYVRQAVQKKGAENRLELIRLLESRLDNVVFKMGLAKSRGIARQLVSHGYIFVNDRKINIPSFRIKAGDVVKINPLKSAKTVFRDLDAALQKYETPKWINLDKNQKTAKILNLPSIEESGAAVDLNKIIEFYAK